jgi:hypothetical protein
MERKIFEISIKEGTSEILDTLPNPPAGFNGSGMVAPIPKFIDVTISYLKA